MRIVILFTIGLISFLVVFLPGYFLIAPQGPGVMEQGNPVEGMEEANGPQDPGSDPGAEPLLEEPSPVSK